MFNWICPHSLANAISSVVLAIGIAIIAYLDSWWPALALVLGASIFTKQFLRRRFYEAFLNGFIFGGIFFASNSQLPWQMVLPVILVVAAITNLFREVTRLRNRPPHSDLSQQELEEDIQEQHEHHHS